MAFRRAMCLQNTQHSATKAGSEATHRKRNTYNARNTQGGGTSEGNRRHIEYGTMSVCFILGGGFESGEFLPPCP